MKRIISALCVSIAAIALSISAQAEVSVNLQLRNTFSRENKLVQQDYVNADGVVTDATDVGFATVKYIYENGNLTGTVWYDAAGRPTDTVDGWARITAQYNADDVLVSQTYTNAAGQKVNGPDGWAMVENVYADEYLTRSTYTTADGSLLSSPTQWAIYEADYRLMHNGKHQLLGERYLNADKRLMNGPDGWAKATYTRLNNGDLLQVTFVDANRNLVMSRKAGYAKMTGVSQSSKVISTAYYNADDQLIPGPKGYASITYEYTSADGLDFIKETYYDENSQPYQMPEGYYAYERGFENKREVSARYFGADGERILLADGYSGWVKTFDARGQMTSQTWLDTADNPMIVPTLGYAVLQNTYEDRTLVQTDYYDEKHDPICCLEGYHSIKYKYDNRNRVSEMAYYDTNRQLAMTDQGYAIVQYTNDNNGQHLSEIYLDTDKQQTPNTLGAGEVRFTWDKKNKTSEAYFMDNTPVEGVKGWHRIEYLYNNNGKVVSTSYFGTDGKLKANEKGVAREETVYDANGRVAAKPTYDEQDQLIVASGKSYAYTVTTYAPDGRSYVVTYIGADGSRVWSDGCAAHRYVLNSSNLVTEEDFLDDDGNLLIGSSGYAVVRRRYNENRKVIWTAYYDANNQPMPYRKGETYYQVAFGYDAAGNTIREQYLDAEGNPVLCNAGYAEFHRSYDNQKRVTRIDYFGVNGEPILNNEFVASVANDAYDEWNNAVLVRYYGTDGNLALHKNGYAVIRRRYDENRKLIWCAYFDTNDEPILYKNGDTYYQIAFEYDAEGNTIREQYLDADGNPMLCSTGYAEIRRSYDDTNRLARTDYLGTDGEPTLNTDQVASIVNESFDEYDNVTVLKYLNAEGSLALYKDSYAVIRRRYNENKKILWCAYYDENDEPIPYKNGDTYYQIAYEYDEAGNTICEQYLDADSNPVLCNAGYAEFRRSYDDQKRVTRIDYFGTNGEPVLNNEQVASIANDGYDEWNNAVLIRYYDEDGNLTLHKNGYAVIRRRYNENRKVVWCAYYDANDEPIPYKNGDTYYQIAFDYDDAGNTIREQYFDGEGNPMLCNAGYAEVRRVYDDQKRITRIDYFGTDGQPILSNEQVASIANDEYDEWNNAVLIRYYGTDGNLTLHKNGYAVIRRRYNENRKVVWCAYSDENDESIPYKNGDTYYQIAYEYDAAGNTVREQYLDAEGNPILCNAGYAELRRSYDDQKRVTRIDYFGTDGQPILNNEQIASVAYDEYDEWNNVVLVRYYGTDGSLTLFKNEYAIIRRRYNENRKILWCAYSGTNDEPIPYKRNDTYYQIAFEYDSSGNTIREQYLDTDGNPMLCSAGYAEIRWAYDDENRLTRTDYLDTDGEPTLNSDQIASIVNESFDEYGNVTVLKYLNADGSLALYKDSYAVVRRRYNENKKILWCAYYDESDEPIPYKNGDTYYQIAYEYDAIGNTIREQYLDADGNPALCNAGYAEFRRSYDDQKRVTRTDYFGTNGEPVLNNEQVASVANDEYDEWNNAVLIRYYGTDGYLTLHKNGYAVIRRKYNEDKKIIWCAYSDADDQPIPYKRGDTYFQIAFEYDAAGNTVHEQYFDAEGNPILCNAGYAELRRAFDDLKRITRIDYFGTDGLPILNNELVASVANDEYDEWNNAVLVRHYGTDGNLTLHKNGYAVIRRRYNENRKIVWCAYFDTNNEPIPYKQNDTYYQIAFEYDAAGNAVRERYLDADGNPMLCNAGYAEIRRTYDNENRLARTDYLGTNGEPILNSDQVASVVNESFDEYGNVTVIKYLSADGSLALYKGSYAVIRRRYNEDKKIVWCAYFDENDKPIPYKNGDTYYQIAYDYDAAGNTIREQYLDAEGNPILCNAGYAEFRRTYDDQKRVTRIDYFGIDGEPILNNELISSVANDEYDEWNNAVLIRYYGTDGNLTLHKNGYAVIRRKYNEDKKIIWCAYSDANDQPLLYTSRDVYYQIAFDYDDAGNTIREQYFDGTGNLMLCKDGYAEIHRAFDDQKRITRIDYFGTDGQPVLNNEQIASVANDEYDEWNNATLIRYYGTDGHLTLHKNGYAVIRRKYNEDKKIIWCAYSDADDQPIPYKRGDTYFQIAFEYDAAGNTVHEQYFDAEGNPILCNAGYAELRRAFDDLKRITRIDYFGTDGLPILNNELIASVANDEYDEWNNAVLVRHYGTDGNLTLHKNGYAVIRRRYDENRKLVWCAYFGTNDEPIPYKNGDTYYQIAYEYDAEGNTIREQYLDADGNPMLCNAGYAEIRRTYDSENRLVRTDYFGINGEPTLNSDQISSVVNESFDEYGNVTVLKHLNVDGSLALYRGGYAVIRRRYNDDKKIVWCAYYGVNDEPVLYKNGDTYYQIAYEYDAAGNTIREQYFDGEGNPMLCIAGYAGVRRVYDDQKRITRIDYFGTDGQPILNNEQIASVANDEYDEWNNAVLIRYYGTDGNLTLHKNGYAVIRRRYNENRKIVLCAYSDANDEPIPYKNGDTYYQIAYEYDAAGNTVREQYLDTEGNPILCNAGYAEFRRTYDDQKRVTRIDYFGVDGEPILNNEQVASVANDEYDEWNNAVLIRYYGTDGNLTLHKNGYAVIRRRYNENRKILWCAYYGVNDEPIPYKSGDTYFQIAYEYDADGNVIREQYFDGEGNPMLCNAGYAEVRKAFTAAKVTETSFWGVSGEAVERTDGVHRITYAYDESGKVTEELHYNKSGEQITE